MHAPLICQKAKKKLVILGRNISGTNMRHKEKLSRTRLRRLAGAMQSFRFIFLFYISFNSRGHIATGSLWLENPVHNNWSIF